MLVHFSTFNKNADLSQTCPEKKICKTNEGFELIEFYISAVDAPPQPQVDGTAPTFSKKPTIRQEDDGNTLVFHCAIVADPSPLITWYHNGVKVQDTSKYQVRTLINATAKKVVGPKGFTKTSRQVA